MTKKLICAEFNELCPSLLEKWMGEGVLPNFSAFYQQSLVYKTQADAPPPNLEPWIQWFTIHTGVPFSEHKVAKLTDGPRSDKEDIWTYLASKGVAVGNFSSMNSKGFEHNDGFYFPDPWSTTESPFPEELKSSYNFISSSVKGHMAGQKSASTLGFLKYYLSKAFSLTTSSKILFQLISEKFNKANYWKRTFILDWISLDLFSSLLKAKKPQFVTFFSNSTAHIQHTYWRHMEPEKFKVLPPQEEIDKYQAAIKTAYINHDVLLGKLMKLADKLNYKIILSSALSQQAFTKYEEQGGQRFYRLKNVNEFLQQMGFGEMQALPVMTHQFRVACEDQSKLQVLKEKLEAIKIDNKPLFYLNLDDKGGVLACAISSEMNLEQVIDLNGQPLQLKQILTKLDDMKSGGHHPEGILWIESETHSVVEEPTDLVNMFPTVCDFFDVEVKPGLSGQSLLPSQTT